MPNCSGSLESNVEVLGVRLGDVWLRVYADGRSVDVVSISAWQRWLSGLPTTTTPTPNAPNPERVPSDGGKV